MTRARRFPVPPMKSLRLNPPWDRLCGRFGRFSAAKQFTNATWLFLTLSLCGQLSLPFHGHYDNANEVHIHNAHGEILETDPARASKHRPVGSSHDCSVCALQVSASDSTAPTRSLDLTTQGLFFLTGPAQEWKTGWRTSSDHSPLGPRAPPALKS